MYARIRLGEFIVPSGNDWPMHVSYIPRPPVVSPGALNPWQQERQRVLWMAEETAWRVIQPLMAKYKAINDQLLLDVDTFNRKLREFESLTGKKTGIQQISTYGSFVSVIPGFQILGGIFAALGFLGGLFGSSKKKKAEQLGKDLQALQAKMVAEQQQLQSLADQIGYQVGVTDRTKQAQAQQVQTVMQQSSAAYDLKQAAEAQAGQTLEQLNLYARSLYPTRQGGRDAL